MTEFNIKDMKRFEADWRLPKNLTNFASASSGNKIFIAGGKSRNHQSGETEVESSVYEVTYSENPYEDGIELGK